MKDILLWFLVLLMALGIVVAMVAAAPRGDRLVEPLPSWWVPPSGIGTNVATDAP